MTTCIIGIDAATQPKKIGLSRGHLERDGSVVIDEAFLGSAVESVPGVISSWLDKGPCLLAVDAPLGWPAPLTRSLGAHRAGHPLEGLASELFRRTTDVFVHETLGRVPLEVGADRIARTAHAALGMLDEVRRRTGLAIPLAWSPRRTGVDAVEVYPAATLRGRRVATTGYKGPGAAAVRARRAILNALRGEWTLQVGADVLGETDDLLDAALCVLAGADFLRGQSVPPSEAQREVAEVEGWIWVRGLAGIRAR